MLFKLTKVGKSKKISIIKNVKLIDIKYFFNVSDRDFIFLFYMKILFLNILLLKLYYFFLNLSEISIS